MVTACLFNNIFPNEVGGSTQTFSRAPRRAKAQHDVLIRSLGKVAGETDTDTVTITAQTSQDKAIILKAAYPSSPALANYIKINSPGAIELRSAGTTIGNGTGNSGINFTDNNWNVGSVVVKSSGQLALQDSSSNFTNLTLTANEVSVKGPFKLEQYTTTQRNALTAANGHMIYNTTVNKFQGYANGVWVDLH